MANPYTSSWSFYQPLTDANLTSLASFAAAIVLAPGNDVFTHANNDGSDIRFYDVTTDTAVSYWIEDWDRTGNVARIWIKPASTGSQIRMYYGNASASSESDYAAVLDGTGFDADWGDVATQVAGPTGEATRLAASNGPSDQRNLQIWKWSETPILSIADLTAAGVPAGNYTGLREFSPPLDSSNKVHRVGGKFYAFFARRPTNAGTPLDKIDTYRAESTVSPYGPWSNFVPVYSPPSTVRLGYVGCVRKIGSLYYMYISQGWDTGGSATPSLTVWHMTSPDLIAWSAPVQTLSPSMFKDSSGNPCTDCGNPWVIRLADGTYMLVVEADVNAVTAFSCNGAVSPDGVAWAALNGGNPLVQKSSTPADWDGAIAANPKCFQLPDGSLGIMYNGGSTINPDFYVGFAFAGTPAGPYVKALFNPVAGRPVGAYGLETSAFCYDADGASILNVVQRFATTSNTAAFYRLVNDLNRGGLLLSRDVPADGSSTDASVAGIAVGPGTFVAETRLVQTAQRSTASTPIILGIYNAASLPPPGPNSTFDANRVLDIIRWSHDTVPSGTAGPGDITIRYTSASLVATNYWTGTAWNSTPPYTGRNIPSDHLREVICSIADDGTKYIINVTYADDGSTVASAFVAKSNVMAHANRLLWCGDPATNAWNGGLWLRRFSVRPYASIQPAFFTGPPVSIGGGIPPVAADSLLLEDGSFLLLEDGSFLLLETSTPIIPPVIPPAIPSGPGVVSFVQKGDSIDYIPLVDVPAGSVVDLGNWVGITLKTIPAGELGALQITGICRVNKEPTEAIAFGATVYWNGTAVQATGIAGISETIMGKCVKAALAGELQVRVVLGMRLP